jgi:hypothetical protein
VGVDVVIWPAVAAVLIVGAAFIVMGWFADLKPLGAAGVGLFAIGAGWATHEGLRRIWEEP